MIQGTDEWIQARVGSLGASRLHEAVSRTKTGWGAGRANLMAELVVERLTRAPVEQYMNQAMIHGIETEPDARAAYEFHMDAEVIEVGLSHHPTIEGTHASPDGLVGRGLVEIKCPNSATHINTLLGASIPKKYIIQMQWQMVCTDAEFCDFVSYDPRMPEKQRLFCRRIQRDDDMIQELEHDVKIFLSELEDKLEKLRRL